MTRSILTLPPVLQEVWSRVYAAIQQGERAGTVADDRTEGWNKATAAQAEDEAWESVRRANGGVLPDASAKETARAITEACTGANATQIAIALDPRLEEVLSEYEGVLRELETTYSELAGEVRADIERRGGS